MKFEVLHKPVMVIIGIMLLIILSISCILMIIISPVILIASCIIYIRDIFVKKDKNIIKEIGICLDNTKTEFLD